MTPARASCGPGLCGGALRDACVHHTPFSLPEVGEALFARGVVLVRTGVLDPDESPHVFGFHGRFLGAGSGRRYRGEPDKLGGARRGGARERAADRQPHRSTAFQRLDGLRRPARVRAKPLIDLDEYRPSLIAQVAVGQFIASYVQIKMHLNIFTSLHIPLRAQSLAMTQSAADSASNAPSLPPF